MAKFSNFSFTLTQKNKVGFFAILFDMILMCSMLTEAFPHQSCMRHIFNWERNKVRSCNDFNEFQSTIRTCNDSKYIASGNLEKLMNLDKLIHQICIWCKLIQPKFCLISQSLILSCACPAPRISWLKVIIFSLKI